jgi:hypothetical protein
MGAGLFGSSFFEKKTKNKNPPALSRPWFLPVKAAAPKDGRQIVIYRF